VRITAEAEEEEEEEVGKRDDATRQKERDAIYETECRLEWSKGRGPQHDSTESTLDFSSCLGREPPSRIPTAKQREAFKRALISGSFHCVSETLLQRGCFQQRYAAARLPRAVELQRLPELKPQAAIDNGSTKFRTKTPSPT
jgi:hypothetical protein